MSHNDFVTHFAFVVLQTTLLSRCTFGTFHANNVCLYFHFRALYICDWRTGHVCGYRKHGKSKLCGFVHGETTR